MPPFLSSSRRAAALPVTLRAGDVVWMRPRDDFEWDGSYIVWCDPQRLRRLWGAHAPTQRIGTPDRWAPAQRAAVESGLRGSSPDNAVPVACVGLEYIARFREGSRRTAMLERLGLHALTIAVLFGFTDGAHRTAWLIDQGATRIPVMVTNERSARALERHAGAGIAPIPLLARPVAILAAAG